MFCSAAFAQTSEFTYQGRLVDGSLAASGTYKMRFRLFDAETEGTQQPQPGPITIEFTLANGNAVVVSNGIFTVKLDFTASAFPGAARFLEISIRRNAADPFTTLNPRQPITSAPHNIRSLSSQSSDGLSVACVLCVTDAQIQSLDGSKVAGTVANATTAVNISGIVPIANGGTGSSTQNFVDLSTNQNIVGIKTFLQPPTFNGATFSGPAATFNSAATFNNTVTINNANPVMVSGVLNVGGAVNAEQFGGSGEGLTNIPGKNISGIVQIANGGTGSSTQNFVDLSTNQSNIGGNKTFTGAVSVTGANGVFNGNGSGLTNVSGVNRPQIALLKWYDINRTATFLIPPAPSGIAFDGESMRLGFFKIKVSDGTPYSTTSSSALGVAFDGINLWCTGIFTNQVSRLRGTDSGLIANYPVGSQPGGVVFDGANIWVVNNGSNNVTKLRASDGACVGTCAFPAGTFPNAIGFDGANIWVGSAPDNMITKLRASDGTNIGTIPFSNASAMAFDGINMWVVNQGSGGSNGSVTKIRASDNAVLGTFPVGRTPLGIAYDGSNVWITNWDDNTVTRLRASDGACIGTCTIPAGVRPVGIAFDGSHIWVVNTGSNTLSKL